MLSVQALLDGDSAPPVTTSESHPVPVPVAADGQVVVRSLAEQLVSEANVVLREHGDVISLQDETGPGELTFTLAYRERSARLQTVVAGRTAVVRLILDGRAEGATRRLAGADELQALVLGLIAPAVGSRT
jgi:hypothetical protein